jgi:O-antigen/teichoic acid export membrane protein
MLSRVSAVMVVGVGVLTLPVLFWGEQILEGLFGPGFGQSVTPLLILSLGAMIGSALGPGATLLNMTGHEKRVTYASLWSLVVLVSLAVPLVVFWGEMGAAVANSLTFVFWSGLMWWDSRKLLGVDSSIFQLLKLKFH